MANLKKETLQVLHDYGYKKNDIDWIGCEEFTIPIDRFWELADTEYYSGYGWQEVAEDLIIVLKDGTLMTRGEYDGLEYWECHKTPEKPSNERDIKALTIHQVGKSETGWKKLKELNHEQ